MEILSFMTGAAAAAVLLVSHFNKRYIKRISEDLKRMIPEGTDKKLYIEKNENHMVREMMKREFAGHTPHNIYRGMEYLKKTL